MINVSIRFVTAQSLLDGSSTRRLGISPMNGCRCRSTLRARATAQARDTMAFSSGGSTCDDGVRGAGRDRACTGRGRRTPTDSRSGAGFRRSDRSRSCRHAPRRATSGGSHTGTCRRTGARAGGDAGLERSPGERRDRAPGELFRAGCASADLIRADGGATGRPGSHGAGFPAAARAGERLGADGAERRRATARCATTRPGAGRADADRR